VIGILLAVALACVLVAVMVAGPADRPEDDRWPFEGWR
jgi:hypothetical protein